MLVSGLITFLALWLFGPTHSEAKLNVYPRVAAPASRDRILIIAPHIDDEAIAAAGYAADAIASGADVYVAFLTAGDCSRVSARVVNKTIGTTASSYLSVGRTRIAEAHAAMRLLGVPSDHYFILGYPDRGLRTILDNRADVIRSRGTKERAVPYDEALSPGSPYSFSSLMADVEHVVARAKPTTIIAPVAFDLHPDHGAAAEITDLIIDDLRISPNRLGYLVHARRIPTSLVRNPSRALVPPARMKSLAWGTYPLSPSVQKKKENVLMTYKSQGAYLSILRNAFVRTNELFFVYDDQPRSAHVVPRYVQPGSARIAIAR